MERRAEKFLYGELSYLVNGLLFGTHNDLGRFARERQYADMLESLLKKAKIPYKREVVIEHPNLPQRSNIADFVIDGKILIELKAKARLFRDDYQQVLRYLQCSGLKLGILANFRSTTLTPYRIINSAAKE